MDTVPSESLIVVCLCSTPTWLILSTGNFFILIFFYKKSHNQDSIIELFKLSLMQNQNQINLFNQSPDLQWTDQNLKQIQCGMNKLGAP